jgi:hypothetical protein
VTSDDRSLQISGGLRVSFDTYFNAFFESYWFGCTSVEHVNLRLRLAGEGVISVYRHSGEGPVYPVARVPFDSPTATTHEITFGEVTGFAAEGPEVKEFAAELHGQLGEVTPPGGGAGDGAPPGRLPGPSWETIPRKRQRRQEKWPWLWRPP